MALNEDKFPTLSSGGLHFRDPSVASQTPGGCAISLFFTSSPEEQPGSSQNEEEDNEVDLELALTRPFQSRPGDTLNKPWLLVCVPFSASGGTGDELHELLMLIRNGAFNNFIAFSSLGA